MVTNSKVITSTGVHPQKAWKERGLNEVYVSPQKLRTVWLVHLTNKSTSRQSLEDLKQQSTCVSSPEIIPSLLFGLKHNAFILSALDIV